MNIGVDVGGTTIKAGLVADGKITEKITVQSPKTKKAFLNQIVFAIDILNRPNVKTIGIGCPGPADYEKGVIGKTPNIPLKNTRLLSYLKKKFKGKKIAIQNDSSCFVLGESLKMKESVVAGLTLGTGVGGGIVVDKKIFSGKGNAGEFGHCVIDMKGVLGKDNIEGSVEGYISAEGVKSIFGKDPQSLNEKQWKTYGKYLGICIANLNNTIDPDIIIIGGSIARSYKKFFSSMKSEMRKRTINNMPKIIKGDADSGIIGAASILQ